MKIRYVLLLLVGLLLMPDVYSKVFYVSPIGNDVANSGTKISPLASVMRAQQVVEAGDTVYFRGGKYLIPENKIALKQGIWAMVNVLDKSGKPGKRINYWAYPGEKPVFDLSAVKPEGLRVMVFSVSASWIHFKGLEVVGTQVTILNHTQSECFHNEGSNNIYEQLSMHDGQAIGFYLTKGSNNLILNCDAYRNYDFTSEGGKGGNSDGFGCHPSLGSTGNVFRGCRAWFNSDDGFDCIHAYESVTFENCWAFYNGYSTTFKSLADGNGFKAGGWGKTPEDKLPEVIPSHTVQFCVAVRNKANGFYSNHQLGGSYWYNNTAYENGTNYNMLNRLHDNKTDVAGYKHVLKNNLGFDAKNYETLNIDLVQCELANNSFSMPGKVTKADFLTLDQSLLTAPRQADGSLPDTNFLKLKKGSKLIDCGAKLGFKYFGKAPDIGAFESK